MKLRTPRYYADFVCIADRCKDNCCRGGWQIEVDEETFEYYKSQKGPFAGELLAALVSDGDSCYFNNSKGECPMLDEKGLCRVYQEMGEEHMGTVCTQFPRFSEYFGDVKETGVGLSCEEAARLIFTGKLEDAVALTTSESDEEVYDDPEFEEDLAEAVFTLRSAYMAQIANKNHPFGTTMAAVLLHANKCQLLINAGDYEAVLNEARQANALVEADSFYSVQLETLLPAGAVSSYGSRNLELVEPFTRLENYSDAWEEEMKLLSDFLGREPMLTGFATQMTDFERSLNGGEREDDYRKFVEYLLFRYMAGTCYSHDLLENVKIAAVFYLLLRLMDVRRAKEKKAFMFEDRMEIIHLFSREVEYSDENMEMLREELMFDECFKTNSLISALTNFEFRVI